MQSFFKSDDPVRDAERHAQAQEMELHKCFICDLDIEPGEKFAIHTEWSKGGWRDIYFCEFCLKSALQDLMTYEQEGA